MKKTVLAFVLCVVPVVGSAALLDDVNDPSWVADASASTLSQSERLALVTEKLFGIEGAEHYLQIAKGIVLPKDELRLNDARIAVLRWLEEVVEIIESDSFTYNEQVRLLKELNKSQPRLENSARVQFRAVLAVAALVAFLIVVYRRMMAES